MTAMACGPLSWELSQGRGLAWLWHLVTLPSPTSPLCQGEQRQRTPGSFQTYVFLWDSPLSGAKISQRKQVPICYNLEISKIPLFMLCLFWKIEEMSTDKWKSPEGCFENIAKLNHNESQTASKLLFLGTMPDLNKQKKQKINKNSKLKVPVSNLIQMLSTTLEWPAPIEVVSLTLSCF